MKVYCDNISTSYMIVNPGQHDRSKHIVVDYYFVCERVAHGDPVVRYIPTKLQLADIFTEGLSSQLFNVFRDNLSVRSPNRLRGVIGIENKYVIFVHP